MEVKIYIKKQLRYFCLWRFVTQVKIHCSMVHYCTVSWWNVCWL